MKQNENAFGTVGILALIVTVGLICGAGYFLSKHQALKEGSPNTVTYIIDPNNSGSWSNGRAACTKMAGPKPDERKTISVDDEAKFLADAQSKRLCANKIDE